MSPSASASRGSGNGYRVLKKGAGMPVILAHDVQEMVLRQKKGARLLFHDNPATPLTAGRWRSRPPPRSHPTRSCARAPCFLSLSRLLCSHAQRWLVEPLNGPDAVSDRA